MINTMRLSISVADQDIAQGVVMIDEVVSDGSGWAAVYAQLCDGPGALLGYASIAGGVNKRVAVAVDVARATETAYALLHVDTGEPGIYEFPGADRPAAVAGVHVAAVFRVTGPPPPQAIATATVEPDARVVLMGESCYEPLSLTLPAGSTVVWNQMGIIEHNVVAEEGSFQSSLLTRGETFEHMFSAPGRYPYYCSLHGGPGGKGMAGAIIIIDQSVRQP